MISSREVFWANKMVVGGTCFWNFTWKLTFRCTKYYCWDLFSIFKVDDDWLNNTIEQLLQQKANHIQHMSSTSTISSITKRFNMTNYKPFHKDKAKIWRHKRSTRLSVRDQIHQIFNYVSKARWKFTALEMILH